MISPDQEDVLRGIRDHKKDIWYFAYGSNMRSSVMTRRRLTPRATKNVFIPSHYLCFDIYGMPYDEPSMASMAPFTARDKRRTDNRPPPVHGIAYLISYADWVQLTISESAGLAYNTIRADAYVLSKDRNGSQWAGNWDSLERITIHSFVARYPFRPNPSPSLRYKNLLIAGAEEHGLPEDYIRYLEAIPSFSVSTSPRTKLGARVFLFFWQPFFQMLKRTIIIRLDENGHAPSWLGGVFWAAFSLLWWHHDYVHSLIWGCGDGMRFMPESLHAR